MIAPPTGREIKFSNGYEPKLGNQFGMYVSIAPRRFRENCENGHFWAYSAFLRSEFDVLRISLMSLVRLLCCHLVPSRRWPSVMIIVRCVVSIHPLAGWQLATFLDGDAAVL